MVKSTYLLRYDPVVLAHVAALPKKFHRLIQKEIEAQLLHEPLVETTNRKPLRQPAAFAAAWELRLGPNNGIRVFYRATSKSRLVRILAVGEKRGERLYIAGEEFEL
jgi:hypothetical protein